MLKEGITILFKIDESRRRKRRKMTTEQLIEERKREFKPVITPYWSDMHKSMFKNW